MPKTKINPCSVTKEQVEEKLDAMVGLNRDVDGRFMEAQDETASKSLAVFVQATWDFASHVEVSLEYSCEWEQESDDSGIQHKDFGDNLDAAIAFYNQLPPLAN